MKNFGVFVLAFIAIYAVSAFAQEFNWGKRETGDHLLKRKTLSNPGKWFQIVEGDVVYKGNEVITAVNVKDQNHGKSGSKVDLLSGGPEAKKAKIHAISARHYGFNYVVEIYGKKDKKPEPEQEPEPESEPEYKPEAQPEIEAEQELTN